MDFCPSVAPWHFSFKELPLILKTDSQIGSRTHYITPRMNICRVLTKSIDTFPSLNSMQTSFLAHRDSHHFLISRSHNNFYWQAYKKIGQNSSEFLQFFCTFIKSTFLLRTRLSKRVYDYLKIISR